MQPLKSLNKNTNFSKLTLSIFLFWLTFILSGGEYLLSVCEMILIYVKMATLVGADGPKYSQISITNFISETASTAG